MTKFLIVGCLCVAAASGQASYYVNTASSAGGNGTTNAVVGANRAWASLWEGIQALNGTTLSAPTTIYCEGSAADTAGVGSIDVVTTATNYLLITTTAPNRHGSKWDDAKYRLEVSNTFGIRNNTTSYLRVDGLQIQYTQNTGSHYGMKLLGANNTGPFDIRYSNNIVRGVVTSGSASGIICDDPASGTGRASAWNNVVYGFPSGFSGLATMAAANYTAYNNTAYGNTHNYVADGAWASINNVAASPGVFDFVSTFAAASDYNASSDSTAPGAHSRTSQTFSFVDVLTFDLRPTQADSGAKGFATSDPGSGLFSTDFIGLVRVSPWDMGAANYYLPAAPGTRQTGGAESGGSRK